MWRRMMKIAGSLWVRTWDSSSRKVTGEEPYEFNKGQAIGGKQSRIG